MSKLSCQKLRSSSAGVSQQFCLELAPLTDVSMTLVLAWTDPPSSDGALVHDLDLEVLCDVSSWTVTQAVKIFGVSRFF